MTAPLVLVDGSNYIHRAFHALPPLATKAGFPTNAIRGMLSMLMGLQDRYADSALIVVMDAPGKTFRSDIYPAYKAHRPPMIEELRMQIDKTKEVIEAMGYCLLCEKGVEADDVIGTLASQASNAERTVMIASGDKDLMQLVNTYVSVIDTMRHSTYDTKGVKEKFGVTPDLIIDYLALRGDVSDNIPGVAGIGEKSAVGLLNEIGNLDVIYSNLESVANLTLRGAKGMVKKLREQKDQAYLSRKLATIDCAVPLQCAWESLGRAEAKESLSDLMMELEFVSLAKKFGSASSSERTDEDNIDEENSTYETVLDKKHFATWLDRIKNAEYFSLDVETTSLNFMQAGLVGISLSTAPTVAAYIPVGHDYPDAPVQLDKDWVLQMLKPILEDEHIGKIGHNLKYDRAILANHGVHLRGIIRDTLLESYILESSRRRRDLASLVKNHLDLDAIRYEDVAGKGAKQISFSKVALKIASNYAAEDADHALRLDRALYPALQAQKSLSAVFHDLEMPLLSILSDMELQGVLIDASLLKGQSKKITIELESLRATVWQEAGVEFNLDSPKQLQEILYEKLNLPILHRTPQGQPSTAESTLQQLMEHHSMPKLLLRYRELSKLKSTYTDRLPERIDAKTGRVHTSWHQAAVLTGRLSSSDPNLQNIPIRTEDGRRIRQAFVAPAGRVLLAADYSQIELRIMAHLSEDPTMCQAFAADEDIHRDTAAEIFSVSAEDVTTDQRRHAKATNFGLIYGMSSFGLSRQLQLTRGDANRYIERYFNRYPGVKHYMDSIQKDAHDRGYVETLFGRQLKLAEIHSKNFNQRRAAERVAINAPVQGTAADIIKRAMRQVFDVLQKKKLPAVMIMQVHDELVLETDIGALAEVQQIVVETMENAASLRVPLKVDVGSGANWDEAHG